MKSTSAIFWLLPLAGLAAGLACGRFVPSIGAAAPDASKHGLPSDRSAPASSSGGAGAAAPKAPGQSAGAVSGSAAKGGESSPTDLQGILKLPSVLHKRHALKEYFDRLKPGEFPQVLEALQNYRGMLDSKAIGLLFRSWFVADPDAAILHAMDVPLDEGRADVIAAGMRAWGRKDPKAAREFAAKLPDEHRMMAIAYIDSLSGLQTPVAAPRETLQQILAEPTVSERKVWTLFLDWATRDPASAAKEAAALSNPALRDSLLESMAYYWARQDAQGASRWIANLPAGIDPIPLQIQVARVVSGFDSAAARDLALALPASSARSELIREIATRWLWTDPASASALIQQDGGGEAATKFSSFYRTWISLDPETGARAFIDLLPAADQRTSRDNGYWRKVADVLDPWAKKNPAAAASFASNLPQPERYEVFARAAWYWCQSDAAAAGAWAQALPVGQARSEMLEQVGYSWGIHDSSKVTEWLGSLPRDGGRNAAIEGFALASFNTDPDGALEWLRAASSERESTADRIKRVWGYWAMRKPDAAQAWLERSTQLSPAERAALQRAASPGQ